jgi:hypothetical protein
MAALPLPGQGQRPSLDPDEVGYVKPSNMADVRAKALLHTPETCTAERCSCHLPVVFNPPSCSLTAREAFVLAWHLLTLDDEEESFEDIGQRLGVTPTRVKQIYQRAGAKLRAHARVHYPLRPTDPGYEAQQQAVAKYHEEHKDSPYTGHALPTPGDTQPDVFGNGAD